MRVGLEMAGRRAAREHYPVLATDVGGDRGMQVGEITSGTFSPTLQKPIAMAYVERQHAEIGNDLTVDVRGTREAARVVKMPFYNRNK